MKGIYKFHWYCGRQGDLNGLFLADSDVIEKSIGKHVYFGEVLGKHSEVEGTLDSGDVSLVSDDPNDVAVFERLKLSTGFNPLSYMDAEEEE